MENLVDKGLVSALGRLLRSDTASNPALTTLLADYVRYHAVLVTVGGFLALFLISVSIFFWQQWRRTGRDQSRSGAFERKVYASFGVLSLLVGLLMSLIVAANASNVLNPRAGFSTLVATLGNPQAGTAKAQRYQAFGAWLQSGHAEVPALVQAKVQARLAWQRPKAALCSLLLLVFAALSVQFWWALLRRKRGHASAWTWPDRALLASGLLSATAVPLLMVLVIANMQAAFAPLTLTLLYG